MNNLHPALLCLTASMAATSALAANVQSGSVAGFPLPPRVSLWAEPSNTNFVTKGDAFKSLCGWLLF